MRSDNLFSNVVQPRIEHEGLLQSQRIFPRRRGGHEDQIPAMVRYGAWDQNELMLRQEEIAKNLLRGAGNPRMQPILIGNAIDNMNARPPGYRDGRENMGNPI